MQIRNTCPANSVWSNLIVKRIIAHRQSVRTYHANSADVNKLKNCPAKKTDTGNVCVWLYFVIITWILDNVLQVKSQV